MNEINNQLEEWRKQRNITEVNLNIKDDLIEEYDEALDEIMMCNVEKFVVELSDICIFSLNWLALLDVKMKEVNINDDVSIHSLISNIKGIDITHFTGSSFLIKDIIDICFSLAYKLDYDMEKVILEKIKVINSREQDPEQKIDWQENGMSGKWLKNKNQDKSSIYIGDFSKCKINMQVT